MNRFRKIIERHLKIQMRALEKPNGTNTHPGPDTLKYLTEGHFAESSELKKTTYSKQMITRNMIEEWKPYWICEGKLNLAIHQFKNMKSPGPDGLRPPVLKNKY